eukprot:scaffold2808_cov255-Pinguiococcus_pyrenoidosus.AAC.14
MSVDSRSLALRLSVWRLARMKDGDPHRQDGGVLQHAQRRGRRQAHGPLCRLHCCLFDPRKRGRRPLPDSRSSPRPRGREGLLAAYRTDYRGAGEQASFSATFPVGSRFSSKDVSLLHPCQGHAVIVVAEGAGEDVLGKSAEVDAGGNRKLPQIGEFLCTQLKEYFKSQGKPVTIKYIDPSYIIRSVPANSRDSYECFVLAQGAVHGAMAGFTGFTVGMVNSHTVSDAA